ncbi:MAG: hypothetical protein IPJ82_14365 [Lewinellaceae bacterium]|nr:hypothetical protein [Lewinellaceae bacterium]
MENQHYISIEAYLRKQLPPERKKAFELKIATDPALAADVAFYEAVLLHHDQKLKAAWKKTGEAMFDAPAIVARPAPRLNRMQWAAAAALALLLTATGIWYTTFYNPYRAIVAEYQEPYRYSGTLSGGDSGTEDVQWRQTLEAYRSKDLNGAIKSAEKLRLSARYGDDARLLSGVIWLEKGRAQEAVQALEGVQTPALRRKAQFYTALAYLEAKEPDKARDILKAIDTGSPYRGKADEVLEKLSKK